MHEFGEIMQSRKFAFRLKIKSGKTTLRTYLISLEEKRRERERGSSQELKYAYIMDILKVKSRDHGVNIIIQEIKKIPEQELSI